MAKWALWAAHRYVWAGAAVPRTVGPDGRLLQRPWRTRSERAIAEARRIRAARPQRTWPRVLGWACIGLAIVGALVPVGPVPRHVRLSAATGPGPEVAASMPALSGLRFDAENACLTWSDTAHDGPFTVVLYGDDYAELCRVDGIGGTRWRPSGDAAARLRKGGWYHATVLCGAAGQVSKSPLLRFAWN